MTSTARPTAVDKTNDSTAPAERAHRLAAIPVASTVLMLELGGAVVRRDWLANATLGWTAVVGGIALVVGWLAGGHLSDRVGARSAFVIGATIAVSTLALSMALPIGAPATGFLAFAATAATTIAGLVALGRSSARPATAIAIVLAAETVLAFVRPESFADVASSARPGVMLAGLILASIAAAWTAIRCLPVDPPRQSLEATAVYDERDHEALGRARLLGAGALAVASIVVVERISGASEPGPSTTAIVVCLLLFAASTLSLRTRLLSAVDLRTPFRPSLVAGVSIAVILGFGLGLHNVVTDSASSGVDQRLALLVPLAGFALGALAIDSGRSAATTATVIIGVVAVVGAEALLRGAGVIDASPLGGLLPILAAGVVMAVTVFALSQVAAEAPGAIAGATMGIALTLIGSSEALGRALNSPTDWTTLDGSTLLVAGAGALACVAAAAPLWRRSLSR